MKDKKQRSAIPNPGPNPGKFFLGLLLLLIGLGYMGESLGWVSINVGYVFQHFWSIFLVFIGLSMLPRTDRRFVYGGMAVGIIMLIAIFYFVADNQALTDQTKTDLISLERAPTVEESVLAIESHAAALKIEGGGERLATGAFQSPVLSLKTAERIEKNIQYLTLNTLDYDNRWGWKFFGRSFISSFYLKLGTSTPNTLSIDSKASDVNLNLSTTAIRTLSIKAAASNVILALDDLLPERDITIDAGASAVTIRAPRTLAIRIYSDETISAHTLPGFTSPAPDTYQSAHYEEQKSRLTLHLNARVSNLTVIWQ